MADPVFGSGDRINTTTLPAELVRQIEGKNPQEAQVIILQFYADRERNILTNASNAIAQARAGNPPVNPPTNLPNNPPVTLTKEQFWNDPTKAVQAMQTGMMTKSEFEAMTAPFQATVIEQAKFLARQGKEHWDVYSTEIEQIMSGLSPVERADIKCWNVAYNNVVGLHWKEIRDAAVSRATTVITEPPSSHSEPAPKVADLATMKTPGGSKSALDVANGLNITPEQYVQGMEHINQGKPFNLTMDNRGRR